MNQIKLPTTHTQIPSYLKAIGAVTVMESAGRKGNLDTFRAIVEDVHGRFSRPDHASVAVRYISRVYDRAFIAALKDRAAV